LKRAQAHRIKGERIDGDDIDECWLGARSLLQRARDDRQPAVIEAVTYRYRGHSVADPGLSYRSKEEVAARQDADPIQRFRKLLLSEGLTPEHLDIAEDRARAVVAGAVSFAEQSPEPRLSGLAAGTYAPGSAEQFAAMRLGSPFGEEELVFEAGLGQ
jgi:pyruvate dehydrogenase E1 component alpha subunit